jgi:3-oxoadipate enol-lactonase
MHVASNGSTFNCRIDGASGPSHGPWVVLAHGLATDLTMWDELTEALKARYRVLRYDARGHGGSAATEGDYSLDMLVADAVGILDRLNIPQCHFGGLSMGGMVTLGMLLDHRTRVTSAAIADSRHTTTPEFTAAWHARAEEVRQGGVDAVVASTVRRWSSEGLAQRNPAVVARMEEMIRRTSDLGYCGCAAALARLNYGHRLGEIDRPTLLICGSEDHGAPPENTQQMHAVIKDSRFLTIEQAGHISNIEHPDIFNEAVVRFLKEVDGDAGLST